MRLFNRLLRNRLIIWIALGLLAVAFYTSQVEFGFPLDDSWIHQVYARNLAQRGEWAFIPGQPSAASTSPLYTVCLALGYWLNIPYTIWPHLIGGVAFGVLVWASSRLARRLVPQSRGIYGSVAFALLLSWHLVWASSAGMETMLFACLVMLLFYVASEEAEPIMFGAVWRGARFGLIAGLATLARPEGLGAAGIIALCFYATRPLRVWRSTLVWSVGALAAFVLCLAPYLVLNWQLTGGLLPNTAAAKQAQTAVVVANTSLLRRIQIMIEPLVAGGQLFLVPGMLYFLWRFRAVRQSQKWLFAALALWPIALILLYALRLPAPFQHGRYVIPALPSAIMAGVIGMDALLARYRASLVGRVTIRSLYWGAFATFIVFFADVGAKAYRQDVQVINEEMVATAHWIRDNIRTDDLLAVHDIGAVGFFAPRPILDIAGLLTPEVMVIGYDNIKIWDLMEQREAKYLMAFPDQIPGPAIEDPRLCLVYRSDGAASKRIGGPAMSVYRLAYDGNCDV